MIDLCVLICIIVCMYASPACICTVTSHSFKIDFTRHYTHLLYQLSLSYYDLSMGYIYMLVCVCVCMCVCVNEYMY